LIKQYYGLSLYVFLCLAIILLIFHVAKAQATTKEIAIVLEYIKKSGGVEVRFFTWIVMWLH
jgi:uncharacterized protein (DUF2141 family)